VKATPGPWFAERALGSARRQVCDLVDGRGGLARWRIVHDGEEEGDAEADALLIAAVPEMADLLLAAWQHVSHGGPKRGEVEAVLRKAGLIS
jgi:hypothetical protein